MYFGFTITREDEANFPEFKSYKEARKYFKERYGEKYVFGDCEMIGDELMFFDECDGQPVQIWASGGVHVVY